MSFQPKPLKFGHTALQPYMSKETVDLHYGKHTKGYFEKTNELIKGTRLAKVETLDELLPKLDKGTLLYNQASQAWNHDFWWENLCPKKSAAGFEKYTDLKDEFIEAATKQFGSGWAWMIKRDDKIEIETTSNADRPTGQLILVVDVWEHAYYVDYHNDRAKYLEKVWNIIDWEIVDERYTGAGRGSSEEKS